MGRPKILTRKQLEYINKRVEGLSPVEAFRGSYDAENMTDKSCATTASKLESNDRIAKRIERGLAQAANIAGVNASFIVSELKAISEMSVADILEDDLTLKPLKDWSDDWKRYVTAIDLVELKLGTESVEAATKFIKKIKWVDKLKALEMLGKCKGVNAFQPEKDVKVSVGLEAMILASYQHDSPKTVSNDTELDEIDEI
jgi:phage terminase small subunit